MAPEGFEDFNFYEVERPRKSLRFTEPESS